MTQHPRIPESSKTLPQELQILQHLTCFCSFIMLVYFLTSPSPLNIINCNFSICFWKSQWRCAWLHTYLYKIYSTNTRILQGNYVTLQLQPVFDSHPPKDNKFFNVLEHKSSTSFLTTYISSKTLLQTTSWEWVWCSILKQITGFTYLISSDPVARVAAFWSRHFLDLIMHLFTNPLRIFVRLKEAIWSISLQPKTQFKFHHTEDLESVPALGKFLYV